MEIVLCSYILSQEVNQGIRGGKKGAESNASGSGFVAPGTLWGKLKTFLGLYLLYSIWGTRKLEK